MLLSKVNAIVTGAAGGLGRHFVQKFLEEGAAVIAIDLDGPGLAVLSNVFSHYSERLHTIVGDVSDERTVHLLMSESFKWSRDCNVLINNAAILRDGLLVKEEQGFVRTLPTIQWQKVLDVNLTGPFLVTREFMATLMEFHTRRPAVVINISSISSSGNPGQSNYAASKAGLDACTRTWALELAPFNVRVVGIAPGMIDTPMLGRVSKERRQELLSAIPVGRIGTADDVWSAIRFALECEFLTGTTLAVDGGSAF